MIDSNEIWKDIPNYEGIYQVSNFGNVCSLNYRHTKKKHILKKTITHDNYLCVNLSKNGKSKVLKIHQLVAMAFLNHKPCGMKLVIDHINDNKFDNRLENLQITSVRYNTCKKQEKYSSKYKGVSFRKSDKKWVARIFIDGKIIYLGAFVNEYDAHLAYQKKCNCLDSDKLFQI